MYDVLKKEHIYNLRIHCKSWLVICRHKTVRLETTLASNKIMLCIFSSIIR